MSENYCLDANGLNLREHIFEKISQNGCYLVSVSVFHGAWHVHATIYVNLPSAGVALSSKLLCHPMF